MRFRSSINFVLIQVEFCSVMMDKVHFFVALQLFINIFAGFCYSDELTVHLHVFLTLNILTLKQLCLFDGHIIA